MALGPQILQSVCSSGWFWFWTSTSLSCVRSGIKWLKWFPPKIPWHHVLKNYNRTQVTALHGIAHPHVLVQGPEITKPRSCRAALQSQRKAQGPQFDTLIVWIVWVYKQYQPIPSPQNVNKKIYLPKWTGPVLRGEGINCDVLSPNEICQVLWAWRSRSRWVCFTFCWQAQVWQYDMWIFVPNSEKSSSTAQMYFPRSGFVRK